MPIATKAVYESGLLRPLEPLSLPERSVVDVTIASPVADERGTGRSAKLSEALRNWASTTEVQVVSAPRGANAGHLDRELDELLEEVRERTSHLGEEEVETLADEACQAARHGT